MASSEQYPVVVVGAGPVGLSVALGLLKQGFAVLVFEQRPELANDPRATTIQPPTLEMLRDLGVLGAVEARGRRVDHLQYWEWKAKPELLADVPLSHLQAQTSLPYRLHCAQPDLCRELYDAIEFTLPGTVSFGAKVVDFTDRGDFVDVDVVQNGRRRSIRAAWVAACDGANSPIRRKLELPMHRLTGSDAFFTCEVGLEVDDVIDALVGVAVGDAAWLFTTQGWALFMRMPDSVRLLFLADDSSAAAIGTDALSAKIRALFGSNSHLELRNRAVYSVRQQVAESWRKGRILILGDAAHATFPVSGTAMNCGIHDGVLLARALPDMKAVERWEQTRREAVQQRVTAHARSTYKAISANGIFSRFGRNRYLRSLKDDPEAARHHALRSSMMELDAPPAPVLTAEAV